MNKNDINKMGEIFKNNKDNIVKWINIILIVLFYYFGVIKSNEKTRVEVIYLQNSISTINLRLDKIDDVKADKEIMSMLMTSINRIEDKLDKMSSK